MPKILLSLLFIVTFATGCASLQRGTAGDGLISTSQPDVYITTPDLTVVTSATANPNLYTSLGYRGVQMWYQLSAPNGKANEAQAVTIISKTPQGWEWELDVSASINDVSKGTMTLGDRKFTVSTYILDADDNAFTDMVKEKEGSVPEKWLARRITRLDYFRTVKLVMDYREPLPAIFDNGFDLMNGEQVKVLNEFAARAEKVFTVQFDAKLDTEVHTQYSLPSVNTRDFEHMLGMMQPLTTFPYVKD
ncbi:MAG: DUF4851 domain-containing protein [Pseudomonadota bacterium]